MSSTHLAADRATPRTSSALTVHGVRQSAKAIPSVLFAFRYYFGSKRFLCLPDLPESGHGDRPVDASQQLRTRYVCFAQAKVHPLVGLDH